MRLHHCLLRLQQVRTIEAGLETNTTVADPVVPVTNASSAQSSLPVSEALAEIASVEPTVAMSDNQETLVVAQAALQDDQPDLMVPKVDGLMTGTDNALQQPLQYGVQTPRTPGAMTAGALIQAGTLDAGLTYVAQPRPWVVCMPIRRQRSCRSVPWLKTLFTLGVCS